MTPQSRGRRLVCSVTAEEGFFVPLWALGSVGGLEKQAARKSLITCGGFQIHRLVHVVGRGVVAVRKPVLEDLLFGRAKLEAHIHLDRRNTFLDEAVLIAADEAVAQRLGISDGL